jgi:hypothetical protein
MPIDIKEDNVRQGVLGLVVALTEIIVETLKHQAIRRMERGSLDEEETERLGRVLKELDLAIEGIKEDYGIRESVRSVRDGLDSALDDILRGFASEDMEPGGKSGLLS